MTDADYTRPAPACACGNTITRFFKAGRPAKYCSDSCKWRAQTLRRYPRAGVKQPPKDRTCACKGCGAIYQNKRGGGTAGEGSNFCSRDCAFAAKAAAPWCSVRSGYCKSCAAPYVSKRPKTYCSEACRPKAEPVYLPLPPRACKLCGNDFEPAYTGGRASSYCGAQCSKAVADATKRIEKAKRKAVLARAMIERVDPFVVFARDGWKCRLCGIRTPQAKRGTFDDDAPELDHILPLSKGGAHSYLNTQCACRQCNIGKADRPLGQMLLIG